MELSIIHVITIVNKDLQGSVEGMAREWKCTVTCVSTSTWSKLDELNLEIEREAFVNPWAFERLLTCCDRGDEKLGNMLSLIAGNSSTENLDTAEIHCNIVRELFEPSIWHVL